MGWSQTARRASLRQSRRPGLECLEARELLNASREIPALNPLSVLPVSSTYGGPSNGYDALIGASASRSEYKVDGRGLSVAVIDAGANYKHPALGGGFGPGMKVSGGHDFAGGDSDPIATNLQHGTAVAGLIASSDPTFPGVAPGAEIVALRVFDDANKSDFKHVANALQWVVDHHDEENISVVNISLSDGRNYSRNWFSEDGDVGQRITELVSKLEALRIPVVTATGNSFSGQQGSGFTGIIANSISVTATDSSDQLVSNAQRLGKDVGGESATDLAAPGVGLLAPLDNGFTSVGGTSFAAPLVSGAIVLMQQVYQHRFQELPTVAQVEGWLKEGASPVTDPATGLTIGRLDIPQAMARIPVPAAQELTPPSPPEPAQVPQAATPPTAPAAPAASPTTPVPDPLPTRPEAETPSNQTTVNEPGPTVQLWMNGQPIMERTAAQSGASSSFVSRVLRSFRDWWGASPKSRVRVWGVNLGGVENGSVALARSVPVVTGHETAPMPRAWQTFVNSRRSR